MNKRKMLFRVLLMSMVLCASSLMTNTVQSFGCTQFCANGYNACMIECNGDAGCQTQCWYQWQCCNYMCDGSGFCW